MTILALMIPLTQSSLNSSARSRTSIRLMEYRQKTIRDWSMQSICETGHLKKSVTPYKPERVLIDSWCSTTKKVMDDKMDELFEMRERDHLTLGYMVWIQLWTRKIQLLRVELAKYGDVFDTIVELTRRFVVE